MKTLYNLKLHEHTVVVDGSLFTEAIRVPGGWVYTSIDKGHRIGSSTFVPWHNEFQRETLEEAKTCDVSGAEIKGEGK